MSEEERRREKYNRNDKTTNAVRVKLCKGSRKKNKVLYFSGQFTKRGEGLRGCPLRKIDFFQKLTYGRD